MAGRTKCSIWYGVATGGSHDGGVAATQPSALVTRPICSWTRTCCSVVQPPPPSSRGMLVDASPSSRARFACPATTSGGSSPPSSSASASNGMSSSAKVAARTWMARSPSDNPYTLSSSQHPTTLTDCSVYVSIGFVPMPFTGHADTADVVVVGGGTVGAWCAYFLHQDGLRVVLVEKGMLGQGASSRAAGVVRAHRGTPEAVRLGQCSQNFYLSQHDEIGIDSGFVAQDICCRAS